MILRPPRDVVETIKTSVIVILVLYAIAATVALIISKDEPLPWEFTRYEHPLRWTCSQAGGASMEFATRGVSFSWFASDTNPSVIASGLYDPVTQTSLPDHKFDLPRDAFCFAGPMTQKMGSLAK